MSDRVIGRVVCDDHGAGMGFVRLTDRGARYQVQGPLLARVDSETERKGPRVKWASEAIDVALEDLDAETALAWCPQCSEWRSVNTDKLQRLSNGAALPI